MKILTRRLLVLGVEKPSHQVKSGNAFPRNSELGACLATGVRMMQLENVSLWRNLELFSRGMHQLCP